MKAILIKFSILLFIISISACSLTRQASNENINVPSWFKSELQINGTVLVSTSKAKNPDDAITYSKNNIKEKMFLIIQSKFNAYYTKIQGSNLAYSGNIIDYIHNHAYNLNIDDYTVLKQTYDKDTEETYVMVTYDTRFLAEKIKSDLDNLISDVTKKEKEQATKNSIEKINFYNGNKTFLEDILVKLTFISLFDTNFRVITYVQKRDEYLKRMHKALNSVQVTVRNDSDLINLKNIVEDSILNYGFYLGDYINKSKYTIIITANDVIYKERGYYKTRIKIIISLYNKLGEKVSSITHVVNGESSNKKRSYLDAFYNFGEVLTDNEIMKLFGVNGNNS